MTPEQLKASILQRAMEGKLVPQDPTDEPASELLKRIKAEKENLIADGKIKRDKKETELFRGADGKPYEKLADGTIQTMTKEDLNFRYRHSEIQELHCIVLQATFALEKGNHAEIKAQMDELTELRELKQPLEYPSCGSVFKRPVGHFTGKLIQDAGLQGLKWGGAQISEKHAGFIVNIDHATATDYVELIAHIQEVIKEKFDVELQTEVRIIGEEV